VYVDYHHTTEDVGIALGEAFLTALGDKTGIKRYGDVIIPMDEALVLCAVDFSGRCCIIDTLDIPSEKVGDFDTELIDEFFAGFSRSSKTTLHIKKIYGKNSHHIIEAAFKAFARAIKAAVTIDDRLPNQIPSTKGVL
ncbi:MAG: imidazoleglycerol-phosphate dehydratase, partial [Oscillospiraceae bacterium]|nr:imidazoleglycerol-phosphate dehydratase [Oscillospiraceae bacterium]